jgi:cytochrome c peroxidase
VPAHRTRSKFIVFVTAFSIVTVLAVIAQPPGFLWNKPAWAPTPIVPADNPMTDAKVQLGRRLFYDVRLSSDETMSCASCHRQASAFTDGQQLHLGVTGELGIRNAMTLTNVAYLPSYTWANPTITSLEKQMLIPLFTEHPVEMGMVGQEDHLVAKLNADERYPPMFRASFPEDGGKVSLSTITKAIAAFERTLLSFNSPYDHYKHGEPNAISPSAKRGEALFFGERLECYHCHGGVNFTDNHQQQGQAFPETGFHNTGLYNEDGLGTYKKWDHGLKDITTKDEDEGSFRTPTLRNIAVTEPYMHDGTMLTLTAVIKDHYAIKGRAAKTRNGTNPLRSEFIEGFRITPQETKDLIAFLQSLTDESFLTNPAFTDPEPAQHRRDAFSKPRQREANATHR